MHSIMANLKLGQDEAIKSKRKLTFVYFCGQILFNIAEMGRYRSLININPSAGKEIAIIEFVSI